MENSWNKLICFESRDLVEKHLNTLFGKGDYKEVIRQINAYFVQARHYFESASVADITVKPLLQYYGVNALSKGLILCLDNSKHKTPLVSSHGLSIKNWGVLLENRCEDLCLNVFNGTFLELVKATNNFSFIRNNCSNISFCAFLKTLDSDDVIRLEQIMWYFPDLNYEFKLWMNKNLPFVILSCFQWVENDEIEFVLNRELNSEELELFFPNVFCEGRDFYCTKRRIKYKSTEKWFPNLAQAWESDGVIGVPVIIPAFEHDKGVNTIGAMYAMSFSFGMMSRYHPAYWMGIMRGEKGDGVFPFIRRALSYIQVGFPKIVVDFFEDSTGNKLAGDI